MRRIVNELRAMIARSHARPRCDALAVAAHRKQIEEVFLLDGRQLMSVEVSFTTRRSHLTHIYAFLSAQ
jgi:hypothetical protein